MSYQITVTGKYPYIEGDERISGEYDCEQRDLALVFFGMDFGRKVAQLDPESRKLTVKKTK